MSRSAALLTATLLLGACSGMSIRPRGATPSAPTGALTDVARRGGPADPTNPAGIGNAGTTRTGEPAIAAASHTAGEQRRVCRAGSRPRGWIAVAYVTDDGTCPISGRRDTVHAAAIITPYSSLPVGSLLDVCADEGVPSGWVRDSGSDENVGESCPGATKNGGSATRRIRRAN